jgi:glycine cleavage system H protein
MSIPSDLKYTPSHEWVRAEADGTVTSASPTMPRTSSATWSSSRTPTVGRKLAASEECAVVESVKAASDVYAPIAGEVIAANEELEGSPETINKDAYGAWMFKLKPDNAADLAGLMDATAYAAHVESEAH